MNLNTFFIIVSVLTSDVRSLRILVHSPIFAGSHTNFMARIADSLTEAGHNVTFFMPIVDEAKRNELGVKLTKDVLVVEQDAEMKSQVIPLSTMMKQFWTQEVTSENAPNNVVTFHMISVLSCANMFRNKKIIEKLRTANFDVAITEPLQVSGLALFRHLGIDKVVISSSCVNYDVVIPAIGEPEETSYLPAMYTHGTDRMNFAERLENYRSFYVQQAAFTDMFDDEVIAYRKYLGADFPDWRELMRDASLHLVNSIRFIDFPRPVIQKTIPIGGISVDLDKIRSEVVPSKLDAILNRRKYNMFISFGSLAKSTEMPVEYRENFLKVIRSEPNVTFIWKYESDEFSFADGVENVEFVRWAPQTALLNDNRLTAFLGHGGLGSSNEAAYLGKPAIMVPIFADQSRNANMLERHGMSIMLPKRYLGDFERVQSAFRSILYDEKFQINARRIADMLYKQPSKPKETAVKHIEFVGNRERDGSSIWHDSPQTYLVIKAVYSSVVTTLYPFSFFCVLKKSPQNFGSLKWFLLLHLICISIAWLANFLLIDYFYYVSTLIVRIDGFLSHFMDSWTLYQISYITYGISLSSSQLIFCNRVFLIANMYQTCKTRKQYVFEVFVYLFVGLLPLGTVPVVWKLTPNQEKAKNAIINNFKVYPECIFEETSVIICNPINNCGMYLAIMNLINVIISTSIIFSATHIAYKLLAKRMLMKSEKTQRMHKKFNQRTFLQAIVVFLFAMFPLFIANTALLLDWEVECLSYVIDFLRENQPNASLLTLFLFYDPYQLYMITIVDYFKKGVKVSVLKVKSANASVDVKTGIPVL